MKSVSPLVWPGIIPGPALGCLSLAQSDVLKASPDVRFWVQCGRRSPLWGDLGRVVAPVVPGALSTAMCSGLPVPRRPAHPLSHEHQVTRDHLRLIGPGGGRAGNGSPQTSRPARCRCVEQAHARLSGTSAAIARARRCPQRRLRLSRSEVPRLHTHQTVALDIVRRPKATPVHELERYMRCKDCSQVRRYPYKRSHLVALRATKITASDPPSTWWPGER